jgi:multidrug efflux pump subunit AcrA (membrane-fusion protein)
VRTDYNTTWPYDRHRRIPGSDREQQQPQIRGERRFPGVSVLALALAVVLATGCSNGKAKEKDEGEAEATTVPVEVQPLRRASMVAVYSGTAPIEAHEEAEVAPRSAARSARSSSRKSTVQAGQVLARLDGDRLRLDLAEIDANLRKLERDYNRQLELSQKGLVAKGTAENAKYDLDALKASYDSARLELSYTEIRAPIAGVVSARHIKVGNTIKPNDRLSASRISTRWWPTYTSRKRSSASSRPDSRPT